MFVDFIIFDDGGVSDEVNGSKVGVDGGIDRANIVSKLNLVRLDLEECVPWKTDEVVGPEGATGGLDWFIKRTVSLGSKVDGVTSMFYPLSKSEVAEKEGSLLTCLIFKEQDIISLWNKREE